MLCEKLVLDVESFVVIGFFFAAFLCELGGLCVKPPYPYGLAAEAKASRAKAQSTQRRTAKKTALRPNHPGLEY